MKVIITNIQRFCLHDGPGIRTTVFFKGCNLKCPWCSNPENMSFEIEKYNEDGLEKIFGREYSLDELYDEIIKDLDFFDGHGGVTFSGGECLWQFKKIEPLLKKLKDDGINICVETALNVPSSLVDIAIKYVDEYYIDMKIVDEKKQSIINANKRIFMNNLIKITNATNNIIIRIPIVNKFTYTKENIKCVIEILKNIKIHKIELFKIHKLGEKKYKSLGRKAIDFEDITNDEIIHLKDKLKKYVEVVEIITI